MSHLEERKEKICLNCQTELHGRYCHLCGQENVEPKESVWHLINHFFQDITHFDGKFFSTVKLLLTKPGFLSKEYVKGRRASYLNPIRMYVFTSAFFFLIFFSLTSSSNFLGINDEIKRQEDEPRKGIAEWVNEKSRLLQRLEHARLNKDGDTTEIMADLRKLDGKITAVEKFYGDTSTRKFTKKEIDVLLVRSNLDTLKKMRGVPSVIGETINSEITQNDSIKKQDTHAGFFDTGEKELSSIEAYDSTQQGLPPDQRDGWFRRAFIKKLIVLNIEFQKDKHSFFEKVMEKFIHSFPKILFISLPFFALILKMVYIRRKQFYYTSHGIFAIHLYCATFILLLVILLANHISDLSSLNWLKILVSILNFVLWFYILIYMYKAMRTFYGQGRFKTLAKYFIVNSLAFIINVVLLVIFVLISAISI